MDNTETMLRRVLLNQAQIMVALMVCTKNLEMQKDLEKMSSATMDLLSDLK